MSDLDPEEFRRLGHAVVDWVAGYRAGIGEHPVRAQVGPGWVRERMPAIPEQPQPFDALLGELDRVVVPATTHWQAPGFFGYFPANADGSVNAEVSSETPLTGEGGLRDGDGSALIIHANEDDHTSQPIGGAGPRIGCAVIK